MPRSLRATACALLLGGLCACGGAASSTTSAAPPAGAAGSPSASASPATDVPTQMPSDEPTAEPSAATPTPVADPCALIPTAKLLSEFHTDAASSRVDAEKQSVAGGQGCIYDLSGAVDVEVILSLLPASGVDTSSGGLTVAGHPAAYRQTEGGAAEIDVTLSATDAFAVSVDAGGGTASPDAEKPQAVDLATVVAGTYH